MFVIRRLLALLALMVGVTALAFALMNVRPDASYSLLGQRASIEQREAVRAELGYDRPLLQRYVAYVRRLVTLDLGHSWSSGEAVTTLLARTIPISLAVVVPGFLLGNILGLGLAMASAIHAGQFVDRVISGLAAVSMSISFVMVMILSQLALASSYGWPWLPSGGWQVDGLSSYLAYVTMPTIVIAFASFGYNARFYRATLVNELGQEYVRTARLLGAGRGAVIWRHALPNAALPILTRLVFSLPVLCISGSLLIETFFAIPGIGRVVFDAIAGSDLPVLQAVVGLAGVLFGLTQFLADGMYRMADPRALRTP